MKPEQEGTEGRTVRTALMITAEHTGRACPGRFPRLAAAFRGRADSFEEHRIWDPGTPELFRAFVEAALAAGFAADSQEGLFLSHTALGEWTRLVCDLNRNESHRRCFHPELARFLDPGERRELVETYHRPYWTAAAAAVEKAAALGYQTVHVSLHSFTPVLDGNRRNADIGILYNSGHRSERDFARAWAEALRGFPRGLKVRLNYPYRGSSDGLAEGLRRRFDEDVYLGFELEVNQALLGPAWASVAEAVARTALRILREEPFPWPESSPRSGRSPSAARAAENRVPGVTESNPGGVTQV